MRRAALLFAFVAGMASAGQSSAQGAYAGIGIMSVTTDNAADFGYAFATSGERSATGVKLYGGYVWPSRFGVEVGYYDLGSYDVFTGNTKTDEFATTAFTVSGVYDMPFARQFVFSGKLGIAFTAADYTCLAACGGTVFSSSKSGVAGLFGVGLGWRPARNFTVRADFEVFADVLHRAGVNEAYYPYSTFSVSGQANF